MRSGSRRKKLRLEVVLVRIQKWTRHSSEYRSLQNRSRVAITAREIRLEV
jgi:hypothetical protein